ncbi:MAG TPA: amidohydrolase family protein [Saprospiraceae bacterium]|nr:amidohydrolase family protein [Saprospiraceae bacterium]
MKRSFYRIIFCCLFIFGYLSFTFSQETFPVNDVANPRQECYAFINAKIISDSKTTIDSATLVIRKGVITAMGKSATIPKDAVLVECKGKYLYPSFIDLYTDYGISTKSISNENLGSFNRTAQIESNIKGAYGWNEAIKSQQQAHAMYSKNESKAKTLRSLGFGATLSHLKDGIARGSGVFVSLADNADNYSILKDKASAHYSFSKGSSSQSYPSSIMGVISLLRQTYYDAKWYESQPKEEGINLSLESWLANQSLPQIFEANDKWNVLRADRIGDEFGKQYIIKGSGNEYQRVKEIKATNAALIIPLNYADAMETDDVNDLRFVGLDDLKHWELGPANPGILEKEGIVFTLTTSDLKSESDFLANVKKAIEYGLSEAKALDALTIVPATMIGMESKLGSLATGKIANFLVTSGPIFAEKTVIHQNWVQGQMHEVKKDGWEDIKGNYSMVISNQGLTDSFKVVVNENGNAQFIQNDTLSGKYSFDGSLIKMSYTVGKGEKSKDVTLSGVVMDKLFLGKGMDVDGKEFTWNAQFLSPIEMKSDSIKAPKDLELGAVTFPFLSYGWVEKPKQSDFIIKNATVWTSEKEGVLQNTDVLVSNGKIKSIGKGLNSPQATVIDGTGKHLSAGIIDEHSHIVASSINEGGQSITSEVRIADVLFPDDMNIYRQLSGGVTTSHILHGSANTIGGQTQLIKMRWGANDEELKFAGADPFIKFALGENVKRSSRATGNNRFPDTRMGVDQVMMDAFTRASDYQKMLKEAEENNKKKGSTPMVVRRDLELDALVEIMNKKRFITCHSYVQSEINAAMKVAEKFGFVINTFTHILEGYKVADIMKAHGANASTFSDWWNYKMEVVDAIAYNAAIMDKVGLNVAINSDDAEMARRLNQEAAKSIKYGGLTEVEALDMVTINPAKMLHIDNQVGSIKVGKDADLVLWSDNPLSIYAKPEKTIVDGIVYFDRTEDAKMRIANKAEKNRLIQKMAALKKSGKGGDIKNMTRARPRFEFVNSCGDHEHNHGLLEIDSDELAE